MSKIMKDLRCLPYSEINKIASHSLIDAGGMQEKLKTLLLIVIETASVNISPGSWSPIAKRWHEEGHEKPAHIVGCVKGEKPWTWTWIFYTGHFACLSSTLEGNTGSSFQLCSLYKYPCKARGNSMTVPLLVWHTEIRERHGELSLNNNNNNNNNVFLQ